MLMQRYVVLTFPSHCACHSCGEVLELSLLVSGECLCHGILVKRACGEKVAAAPASPELGGVYLLLQRYVARPTSCCPSRRAFARYCRHFCAPNALRWCGRHVPGAVSSPPSHLRGWISYLLRMYGSTTPVSAPYGFACILPAHARAAPVSFS